MDDLVEKMLKVSGLKMDFPKREKKKCKINNSRDFMITHGRNSASPENHNYTCTIKRNGLNGKQTNKTNLNK